MVTALKAPKMLKKNQRFVPFVLAGLLILMTLTQLLNFTEFVVAVHGYNLADERGSKLIAALLVLMQIFSLPFLLRLQLSPLARFCSAWIVLLLPLMWLILGLQALLRGSSLGSPGYFAGHLDIPIGWGVIFVNTLFMALAIWAFVVLEGHKLRLDTKKHR